MPFSSPGEYCCLQRVLVELVLSCGGLEVDEEGEAGGVGGGGGRREEGGVEGAQVCPGTGGDRWVNKSVYSSLAAGNLYLRRGAGVGYSGSLWEKEGGPGLLLPWPGTTQPWDPPGTSPLLLQVL